MVAILCLAFLSFWSSHSVIHYEDTLRIVKNESATLIILLVLWHPDVSKYYQGYPDYQSRYQL